jgi:peptidyl-prolyl cis-trans isomerase SurA
MKLSVLILIFTVVYSSGALCQKNDPVLFKVGNQAVHLSEFQYIYEKTNGNNADFSKTSLQEYLDLYVNFKLKVQKAKDIKLDTIKDLKDELAGYRRQLSDNYLVDREVTEALVSEAYEHTQYDVDVSHVFFRLPDNATPTDTQIVWKSALEALKEIKNGKSWSEVALAYSDDQSVKDNQGRIGFVTALFPNGYYNLEVAAYKAELEKVYGPIRTSQGYHLLKVHDKRPARGEVEVAHILIRLEEAENMLKNRIRIDSIYKALVDGANFEELATKYSEDEFTASKGGYIGFFGINRFEKVFEDAAFELKKDGDFSPIIQTSIGWHIIKRISLKNNGPFAMVKSGLQNQVKEDLRFDAAKQAMIARIKKDSDYKENRTTLERLILTLEKQDAETFLTYKWKTSETPSKDFLFSFGKNFKVTESDFANYLQRSSRQRQQFSDLGIRAVVEMLYSDFVSENAMRFEEQILDTKYPEFKALMREYEEGILLFEVTKMEVWDKASLDTVGLKKFYENNKSRYTWESRAVVSQYTLVEKASRLLSLVRRSVELYPRDSVLQEFNKPTEEPVLTVSEKIYEKGRNETLDQMPWREGLVSNAQMNTRDGSANFIKIEKILPPGQKTLQEAKGYVVADYQDYLEKEWLKSLKKTYSVQVDQKVFNSMVKK